MSPAITEGSAAAAPRVLRLDWRVAAGLCWILALRLAWLFDYPRVEADEGGWPMAVRYWLEGQRTSDFYMAPGYHWLLGIPFSIFGANWFVGRATSAVLGLVGLALFHRLARRLAGPRTAWWGVLILGTCQSALFVDRRALMEPFQIPLMMLLALVIVEKPRAWECLAAALTALVLLTKGNAIFLLPVLVLAEWVSSPRDWQPAVRRAIALGAGVLLAAGVFYWLYLGDPATFLQGWSQDMQASNTPGAKAGGRFALHPSSVSTTLNYFTTLDPLAFGLAVAGLCRAAAFHSQWLMSLWLLGGGAFLALQTYVTGNHRSLIAAPFCFLAAWFLAESEPAPGEPGRSRWAGVEITWPRLMLVAVMALATLRMGAAARALGDPGTAAARWLHAHAEAGQVVLGPPYVNIQLGAQSPVTFFWLPKPFLPDAAAIAKYRPAWVVVDEREWIFHMRDAGASEETIERNLRECCTLAHAEPGVRIFRVNQAVAGTATSSSRR